MQNDLRTSNLYKEILRSDIDAFLVTYPANVSYFCRYPIDDSYLLASPKETFLITDFRYIEEAQENIKFSVRELTGSLSEDILKIVKKLKIKRLGFESRHLSFYEYGRITGALGEEVELVPIYDLVEKLRIIKDEGEIAKIEAAVKLTEETFVFLKDIIRPGVKELDISAEVNRFIRLKGAEKASFDLIVASGSRSSMPHAKTSTKIIQNNEPVLVDMGVEISGYKSDLTRMFFLGKIAKNIKQAMDVVFAAKRKAIKRLKPGVPIKEIDKAAREYIASFGWSKNFRHSVGHGVGLEVHEGPHISRKNNSCLKAGMVFTIEPAVYFPQKFGVRLEDMVLITQKGARVLNGTLNN
ncbi:MAG: aminopeptidase P family protein [Candidatus Omnitrophota bacterium]|nr:aminopeptidase P family protein [Candidatus Omnitrophota bacterium]